MLFPRGNFRTEEFANRYFAELLPTYCERFGDPAQSADHDESLSEAVVMRRVI